MIRSQVALLLMIFLVGKSSAQWVRCDGPWGGQVNALASDGSALYAGLSANSQDGGMLFKLGAGAQDWQMLLDSSPFTAVMAIGVRDSIVYAGTGSQIFCSTNGGTTWRDVDSGTFLGSPAAFVFVDSTVFVACGIGVLRSKINSRLWEHADNGLGTIFVGEMIAKPAGSGALNLFAGTSTGSNGVYCSSDTGASWHPVNNGLGSADIRALAVSGSFLYAGTSNGNVFRSTDDGLSWQLSAGGLPGDAIVSLAAAGSAVYASTLYSGVYRSTDNGGVWNPFVAGLARNVAKTLVSQGDDLFAGSNGSGVFVCRGGDSLWKPLSRGLHTEGISDLSIHGQVYLAGTMEAGCYASTDKGVTWLWSSPGMDGSSVSCFAATDSGEFAASYSRGVFRSTDGGSTWNSAIGDLPELDVMTLFTRENDIFAGTSSAGSLWRSSDGGKHWTAASSGITPVPASIRTHASVGNAMLVAGDRIFRSLDGGGSWMPVGPSVFAVAHLAVVGGVVYATTFPGTFFQSNDSGATWSPAASFNSSLHCEYVSGTTIVVGTDSGVTSSADGGATWKDFSGGFGHRSLSALAMDGYNVFAGSDGIWRRAGSDIFTGMVNTRNTKPPSFALAQCYPNPFNPSTTIRYTLPEEAFVRLNVYDLLGREVARLVGEQQPPGEYSIPWSPGLLPSGMYFYRLEAGRFSETRKLSIIR